MANAVQSRRRLTVIGTEQDTTDIDGSNSPQEQRFKVTTRELTPDLWPVFETLFGSNGACGGCWCMSWRIAKGERWEDVKGATAKRRMKSLITRDKAHGLLAFAFDEPVGWCSYGPRTEYSRLNRARTLACEDAEDVWSIPCFFVKRAYRGKGVGSALLKHALRALRKRGARIVEGYPVNIKAAHGRIPDAFAWTGTRSIFESCGFSLVGNPDAAKLRMRRSL